MRRFLVPSGPAEGGRVVLPPDEARHAATVLRLEPGDDIVVFDGREREWLVRLTDVGPDQVAGAVVEARAARRAGVRLTLVQGIPKAGKMDDIVRMGTEIGVDLFLPVLTARSVARPGAGRVERWRRISAEAAKQSRRTVVPEVEDAQPLVDVWPRLRDTLVLVPWEAEQAVSIGAVLTAQQHVEAVSIVIGPEGGFTEEEMRAGEAEGAHAVSLGPLILRTETAGLAAAAMVLYELTLRSGR